MDSEQIKHILIHLYTYMNENNDEVNSQKIIELYHKYVEEEFVISFAGHFSAGKSSMINALLGIDVLPKSPIPTSANIVKLTSGEGYARMYFHEQEPVQYNEPYDMDLVRSYCKDKESIHTVEINTFKQVLPPKTAIYDTPGIDAADDADRLMTEGSLHSADVLFYVMDYNHVQSEVNLLFLQQLQEKRIPFYVIINQIDKHNEQEIAFNMFHQQIEQTFKQWNIHPEKLFYTSLKDSQVEHNAFSEVQQTIDGLISEHREINDSMKRSIRDVVEKHKQFLTDAFEDQQLALESSGQNKEHVQEYQNLQEEYEQFEQAKRSLHEELFKEVNQTLKNAQVMPFEMREHARLYLESVQPQFKVGLFGSKKKTAEEKSRRKEVFMKELCETIESTIEWNLRDKIKTLCETYHIPHTLTDTHVNELSINNVDELIKDSVRRGAHMSGEYVLNYTQEVHSEINTSFRKKVRGVWDHISSYFEEHMQTIDHLINENKQTFSQAVSQQDELDHCRSVYNKNIEQIDHILQEPTYDQAIENEMKRKIDALFHSYTVLDAEDAITLNNGSSNKTEENQINEEAKNPKKHFDIQDTIQAIDDTIASLEGISGFHSYIEDMLDKKDRLEHRSLTVALFGAFSAGKSSFANALLGDTVLPSSPNPTTAVITKISPIDDENSHGNVSITLKEEDEIALDIREMTKELHPPEGPFSELLSWVIDNDVIHNTSLDQMYRAYIHAMVDGYSYMKDRIGTSETIDLEQFATYATDETKACYIKEMDVHYDCSITQKGITLVDTPGADSVNARHTNVSFEYIKEADAILYVTYYNHALSRADKDFLMQLGRVKESFELDKMFFIINAADLAVDEQELKLVCDYVEEQLVLLGIRFPSIYPISSKQIIENHDQDSPNQKKFGIFLNDFFSFLNNDLPSLTMESAYVDIKRSLHALDGHIDYVQLDGEEKEERAKQLHAYEENMYEWIHDRTTKAYKEQIENRIERQLFYVVERFGIRFHDFFKETFNPTTVTESGRKGQEQVYTAANALLKYSGYELLQEIRAIALRVEAELKKQLFAHYVEAKDSLQQIDQSFLLPVLEEQHVDTPDFEEPFTRLNYKTIQSNLKYNGMKAFFVQNEKDLMRENIYVALHPYIDTYIESVKEQMLTDYVKKWDEQSRANDTMYVQQIQSHMEHQQKMLQEVVDVELLETRRNEIKSVVS